MATLDTEPIDWVVDGFNSFLELFRPLFTSWIAYFLVGVILFVSFGIFFFIFKIAQAGSEY